MNVFVESTQSIFAINLDQVAALVKEVISFEGADCDEVGIHFVEKSEICDLHEEYFDDPSPTDCISFPIDGLNKDASGHCMLGDVFVCPEVALEYAKENGEQVSIEITLYIIHGLLHLMGYDDIEEKNRAKMRKAEKRHLEHLQQIGLYL